MNLNKSNGSTPGKSKSWREDIIREEIKNMILDLDDLYAKWLIPKFSKIAKGSRLTLERIEKLIVGSITPQERELLLAMLYNREIILT